jgi:hypothetical protein
MYSMLSAFVFILIATVVVLGLLQTISSMALFNVNIMDKYKDTFSVFGEKEYVHYCYGRILDDSKTYDPSCLTNNLDHIKGLTVSVGAYSDCVQNTVTLMQPQKYSQVEVFDIPVYQNNQKRICPGKLHIYT